MSDTPSNVLLVLLRLDVNDPLPLRARGREQGEAVQVLDEKGHYHLLAGVLDPTNRSTGAPVTGIELTGGKLTTYNRVLRSFQEISERFYREGGFINNPESYTNERQAEVMEAMSTVGHLIYDFFGKEKSPIRDWLDRMLESDRKNPRPVQPVTIVTNDFNIPWFWLKSEYEGRFLCEACPLGLLQLSQASPSEEANARRTHRPDKRYDALVINGTTNRPFADEELNSIGALLESPNRRFTRTFKARHAEGFDDITNLRRSFRTAQLLSDFRIVHFSGLFTADHLLLEGQELDWDILESVLHGSLLVLDGCSKARGMKAWADVEGLTSALINEGRVLGCLVTVLPVKHDPIVSRVLWGAFYPELRKGRTTIAEALFKARNALHKHFNDTGSKNPAWAMYQLMGSAAVELCDDEEEQDV